LLGCRNLTVALKAGFSLGRPAQRYGAEVFVGDLVALLTELQAGKPGERESRPYRPQR
jgi:hypothetical protein